MNKYPEIAVVLVTSHGTIKVNPTTHEPYTFRVPDNMSMTMLNAAAPGVCNMLHSYDADDFSMKMIKSLKKDEIAELLESEPTAFVDSLIDTLKKYDVAVKKDIYSNQKIIDDEPPDVDEEQYIYHYDKAYKIRSYGTGSSVINKEFSRNNLTEQNDGIWNFKIIVLNKTGFPDIIREVNGRSIKDNNTYISLETIVNYLKDDKVKHVVFLDLSCSSFVKSPPPQQPQPQPPSKSLKDIDDDDDEEHISDPRTIRVIRRNIIKKELGGKRITMKIKKRKHSKKTKAYKKHKTIKRRNKSRKYKHIKRN